MEGLPAVPVNTNEMTTEIEVVQEDLLTYKGDGILVPTVSDARMRSGIAARVKKAAGADVEADAMDHVPIAVGAALVTEGGKMSVDFIIHSPLIEQAGMRVGVENIRRATRAALFAATHYRMDTLAIPGMGYGENGVPHDEAARAIIDEVRAFKGDGPGNVTLMATANEMYEAFVTELGES